MKGGKSTGKSGDCPGLSKNLNAYSTENMSRFYGNYVDNGHGYEELMKNLNYYAPPPSVENLNSILDEFKTPTAKAENQLNSLLDLYSTKGNAKDTLDACMNVFSTKNTNWMRTLSLSSSRTTSDPLEFPGFKALSSKQQRFFIAKYLLERNYFMNIGSTGLFRFDDRIFVRIVKDNAMAELRKLIPAVLHGELNSGDYREIFNQIASDPNIQRDEQATKTNTNSIAFKNGTYYIREGIFVESFDPNDLCFSMLDHTLDLSSVMPSRYSLNFVESICERKHKYERLFWQVIGYYSSNASGAKAIPVLWGSNNSGKTTISNVIVDILGENTCTAVPLGEFGGTFSLAELMGKKLCLDTDATGDQLSRNCISNLKKATGGDMIQSNTKYGKISHFFNTCKILLATNNLIKIDSSEDMEAFYSRFVVLPFRRTIPAAERNPELRELLKADRNYFLVNGLKALTELANNNYCFDKVISTEEYIAMVHGKEHAIDGFFHECFHPEENGVVTTSKIMELYTTYSEKKGISENLQLKDQQLIPRLRNRFGLKKYHSASVRGLSGLSVRAEYK